MGGVLGIDIGSSSLKALLIAPGVQALYESRYDDSSPAGMLRAVQEAVSALTVRSGSGIDAVGLSGQTGTYYLEDGSGTLRQIAWHEPGREPRLETLLSTFSQAEFIEWLGMEHPRLASYPLPTLRYFRELYAENDTACNIFQPKDYLVRKLCGESLSDVGSWRGLVNPRTGDYAQPLLDYAGVGREQLPRMAEWSRVSAEGARLTGLREGTPVAVGMNDFYAALYGLGVDQSGLCFDIAGTSEHLGVTTGSLAPGGLVASPYRDCFVHYGVTASSGVSLDWARSLFGDDEPPLPKTAPIFLPYLRGERAPVFDPNARGLFLGLAGDTGPNELKYAVYEGVAFSLMSIYEALGSLLIREIAATGGATASPVLNRMKASLFDVPLLARRLTCGSAIGAAKLAGASIEEEPIAHMPDEALGERMRGRYAVYRRMYRGWLDMIAGVDVKDMF